MAGPMTTVEDLMDVPEALRFTLDHEWLRLESDEAVVGITAYATEELGDVVFVELPAVGRHLQKGEAFGAIESVKTASDLYAPLGGEVLAVNEDLATQPELVNAEPYAAGWMVRLRLDDPTMADGLMDAGAYRAQIGG
jgi:glycine cleavage system H protein